MVKPTEESINNRTFRIRAWGQLSSDTISLWALIENEDKNATRQSAIPRQDLVDSAIFSLVQKMNPTNKDIPWDIEMIANIRDVIVDELQKKLDISEFEIYP